MSQVGDMQNPLRSHDKVTNVDEALGLLTVVPQCRGDYHLHPTWCSGPKPCCLKKHLEIICVHLGLLFFCPGMILLCHHRPIIYNKVILMASYAVKTNRTSQEVKEKLFARSCSAAMFLWDETWRERLGNRLTAQCGVWRAWGFLSPFSFPPLICLRHHSLGTGRHSLHQAWVNISQVSARICIPPSPATTCGHTHAYTHMPSHYYTHTDATASNLPLC